MLKEWGANIIGIATAITGVAIVAVLVSNKSKTVDVIKAAGAVYTDALREAVRPVTG